MSRLVTVATPYGELTAEKEADGRVSVGYGGEHDGPEGVKNHVRINSINYQVRMSLKPERVYTLDYGPDAGKQSKGWRPDYVSIYRVGADGRTTMSGATQKATSIIYREIGQLCWDACNDPEQFTVAWRELWHRRAGECRKRAEALVEEAKRLTTVAGMCDQREMAGVSCEHEAGYVYMDGNRRTECALCGRPWDDCKREKELNNA